jgi:2,4-dienoyl-CoA reductase-like NADH-dependent reductase (Old Yellow Enzyme family)/thioredoxin reductase
LGGAGCVTVSECSVDSKRGIRAKGGRFIDLTAQSAAYNLSRLASGINRNGAVASAELQHLGMNAFPGTDEPAYGPSEMEISGKRILEMPEDMIYDIIECYVRSAVSAKKLGYRMITIHGAHGWLPQQFYSPTINHRKDKWGGSPENRARFAVTLIDEIHKACGKNFPVEIRISGTEVESGYGIDTGVEIAKQLDGHANIIHVSVGGFSHSPESFVNTHVSMFKESGLNVKYAAEIKKNVKHSLVATVGGLSDPYLMEEILASGKADIVELARGLICDPDLPNKLRAGKASDVRKCMRCLMCFTHCMENGDFHCTLNPETSREIEIYQARPAAKPQKVLVAGGGVAGMQLSLDAASYGHRVILCEKSGRLGGAIMCEKDVPFKKNLMAYISQQAEKIAKNTNIELRLNTLVTPEYAKAQNADAVVVAIGAKPAPPNILGIASAGVIEVSDAFSDPSALGNDVLIIGGGLAGTELGIYLTGLGKRVQIIEVADQLGSGGNSFHLRAVSAEISRLKIKVDLNTKAVEIQPGMVKAEAPDGPKSFNADSVVLATGMTPLYDDAISISDAAPYFYMIGDCYRASHILDATSTAFTIARQIGVY